MENASRPYKNLCTQFYELDKPAAPPDAIQYYLNEAAKAKGKILEPMCGSGRFLIPLLEKGYDVTGFDNSPNMLAECKKKCGEKQLNATLIEASFETFHSSDLFQLIFIPSGSFCLLTDLVQAKAALKTVYDHLAKDGKFIFEVETIQAINKNQGVWKSQWIDHPSGSILVGSFASQFDESSSVETILCRYELWQNNSITQMEVEDCRIKHYTSEEIEALLQQQGFMIEKRCIPYSDQTAEESALIILYECRKAIQAKLPKN